MMAEHIIRRHPFSGRLLVFWNKPSDRREIAAWEPGVLLEGIDLSEGQRRKRYELPPEANESCAELEARKQ